MTRVSLPGTGALAALVLALGTPLSAQTPLPPGEGRELTAAVCSQCHALNPVVAMREGPAGWKRHVYNMILRGAQLTPREAETVIQYLAASFGPGAPPPARTIDLPGGVGKELVETRCAGCHDLERVAVIKRPKRDWPAVVANMVSRGAPATPEEADAIAGYLMAQFGSE